MWKLGARDGAVLFVTFAALLGATHIARGAAHFAAATQHRAAPPMSASVPRMGGSGSGMRGAGVPHSSSAAARRFSGPGPTASHHRSTSRFTDHIRSRPTSHANRLAPRPSARSLHRTPTTARTAHGRRPAALAKTVHGKVPDVRGRSAGYLRSRYSGRFTGWSGPLFWPRAYDDIFGYTFWPYDFDQTFWAYAYADVYNSIVWPYGDSVDSIGVPGGPPRLTRSRTGASTGQSQELAQLCGDRTPGLTDWPIERIEQTVAPTQTQQAALLELKSTSARAVEVLRAACPMDDVATPLARLDAMEKRLDAMLRAVDLVRPALESFYNALRDEQKARFNAIGYASNAPQRETGAERRGERRTSATNFCSTDHTAALSDRSIRRIERAVHPTEIQRDALHGLKEASATAIETLRAACPTGIPGTPLARLDVLDHRLDAMARAVKTLRPAMQHFYELLEKEQQAHFNAIGLRENATGSTSRGR